MSWTILAIEDNEEERRIFSTYLQFVGVNLLEASNGSAGLEMARAHVPDLILMDLSMPVMNGWEAVMRLQADPRTAGIPVIAITAHHLDAERMEESGFCGYLEKPLAPYRVLEEVERCLGPLHGSTSRDDARDERNDRRNRLRRAVPQAGSGRELSGTASERRS